MIVIVWQQSALIKTRSAADSHSSRFCKPRTAAKRNAKRDHQRRLVAGQRPSSLTDADPDPHASVCSAISKASSTSMPRYRTVLSSL